MTDTFVTWDQDGIEQWAAASRTGEVPLVHSLRGFIDAGRAGQLVADHLSSLCDPVRVATFDIDQLLDYRSRRPEMTFSVNQWTTYDEPSLQLDMVSDAAGRPYLLLHGYEPDVRWEEYIREVRRMVERLEVTLTIGTHGIPMATPHTRDLTATVHGTPQELLPDSPSFFGTVQVPASAQNLMEYRFGQWGLPAVNIAVNVPHYLSQSAYPQAAQCGLEMLERMTGLALNPEVLDEEAAQATKEIDRQMAESEEVQALVAALEEQHDAFLESRESVVPLDGHVPSADELGAEFEKFLRQQGKDLPPQ